MCYRLLIFSDAPLPLVPTVAPPRFSIAACSPAALHGAPLPVGWYAVEAGSTTGCACAFHDRAAEPVDLSTGDDSLADFARWLAPIAGRQRILVHSTWYDDESDPVVAQPDLTPAQVAAAQDPFPCHTLTAILAST